MVTLINNRDVGQRPRHPEKAHKADTPKLKKPEWIRKVLRALRYLKKRRPLFRKTNSIQFVEKPDARILTSAGLSVMRP